MIDSKINFKNSEHSQFISILTNLPVSLRPVVYSEAEDELRVNIDLTKINCIEDIRGCLWAQDCEYDIYVNMDRSFSIFISNDESEEIEQMMRDFSELEIEFGYACHSDERLHRNRIIQKKEYGTLESWVGRDYNKYLPGLYWITLIPNCLIKKFGIDVDEIRDLADKFEIKSNGNIFARFYDDPDQWQARAEAIDSWCARTPGCFYKPPVESEAAKIPDFMGMSDFLFDYR